MLNKIVLVLILIVSLTLGASTLKGGHEWGDDWAWYILQAKSILDGTTEKFIEASTFTNTQSTTHSGPLAYPWGYPLILVPFYAFSGPSPLILKLPGLVFYSGFLICLYLFAKPRLTRTESLLFVSLFASNPLLLKFLDQILSDIPFLFFSTLTLLLITQRGAHSRLYYSWIGVSIFFTTFLRTTGALLLGSFLIMEVINVWKNRADRETVFRVMTKLSVVCFVFALLWVTNAFVFPGGGESYLSQYANLSLEIVKNFTAAYFNVFSLFFGEGHGWKYIYYLTFIFFLAGAWARRNEETVFILFTILWMTVHITYPYWQGPRYIFPLLPIYIYFAFQGIHIVLRQYLGLGESTGRKISSSFWAILVLIFLFQSSSLAYNNIQNHRKINGPFDDQSSQVYRFLKKNTPEDSVVVFFKPRAMRLMSDRNSIMSTECDRMLLGDFLVLSKLVGENGQIPPERIGSCNLPLKQVFENRKFIIYQVQK